MVDGPLLQGRYRLVRRLAAGGMGSVFEGRDERLQRTVAVKLLRQELADDPRFVERFRREARAVASLSHPSIANVYDYGEDADRYFIVMEFAPGRDLAQQLKDEGPLPVARATHIGAQLCEALDHAHAAGVIHRDIKPANIIIDDTDRIRVTDFGIARAAGDATLTGAGSILGTAHYLSPEQARGLTLTPASDLYSAGIVLYEMLTGEVPFTGDSAIAIAMRHMNEAVPPPSRTNPEVSPEIDAVVLRATAKTPGSRFAGAAEMADALRHPVAPTQRLPAAPPGPPPPNQAVWPIPTSRRNPRGVERGVLLGLLALALAAGSLLAWRVLSDGGPETGRQANGAGNGAGQKPESDDGNASLSPTPSASPEASPTPTQSPAGILISDSFIGANAKDVQKLLEAQGVLVETVDQDSEEEKHTVLAVEPPPGTTVLEGDTVTLIVSTGKISEDDDDGDDE